MTEEEMNAIFDLMDKQESPTTILIPQSLIDTYGEDAIREILNNA